MISDESTTGDCFPKRARVKDWLSTEWSFSDFYDPNTDWILQATSKEGKEGQAFVVLQTQGWASAGSAFRKIDCLKRS